MFEWYDFIPFGSLAGVIAQPFFSKADPITDLIFALLAFSAGFIVRPLGAPVFGRSGDRIGRKYTFLVTILVMGLATFLERFQANRDSVPLARLGVGSTTRPSRNQTESEPGQACSPVRKRNKPKTHGAFSDSG